MASAASNMSVVAVPAVGDVWPSGEEVRLGTAADADAVAQWRSDSAAVNGALTQAAEALRNGSSDTMVYVVDDAQVPIIGVVTTGWKAPYLQFVFIAEPYRRGDVGTKATSVVVDEFFQSRADEHWLSVTSPISTAGARLLLRLGFTSSGSGMTITRDAWEAGLPTIAQIFDLNRGRELEHEESSDTAPGEDDEEDDEQAQKVAIDVCALRVVSDEEARALFRELLDRPEEWNSPLVRDRMTSLWQDDWVIEVGNWLARARSLGFVEHVLQPKRLNHFGMIVRMRDG